MDINKTSEYKLQNDLTQSDLNRLRDSGIVGVDVETTGLDPGKSDLCLIQVSDANGCISLIKTYDWGKTIILSRFLTDPTITKVFHFAIFDCAFLSAKLGIEVSNVYCTKIASKIAFPNRQKYSLSSLVYDFFGVQLDKGSRLTNWCNDTLTSAQLAYAVNDVIWLIKLKAFLDNTLVLQPPLTTGITPNKLNLNCQSVIPVMVHLWLNGLSEGNFVFSY